MAAAQRTGRSLLAVVACVVGLRRGEAVGAAPTAGTEPIDAYLFSRSSISRPYQAGGCPQLQFALFSSLKEEPYL